LVHGLKSEAAMSATFSIPCTERACPLSYGDCDRREASGGVCQVLPEIQQSIFNELKSHKWLAISNNGPDGIIAGQLARCLTIDFYLGNMLTNCNGGLAGAVASKSTSGTRIYNHWKTNSDKIVALCSLLGLSPSSRAKLALTHKSLSGTESLIDAAARAGLNANNMGVVVDQIDRERRERAGEDD
jgi:hypothetical protein